MPAEDAEKARCLQGGNSKAVAAKERKAEVKEKDRTHKEQAAEDAAWAAAGEGSKSKAQAKKEEQVSRRLNASPSQL